MVEVYVAWENKSGYRERRKGNDQSLAVGGGEP
jgi:hypothetical protein